MNLMQLLILSWVLSSLIMVATWMFAKAKNNYSVVDAVWALSFGVFALIFALLGEGALERRVLIAGCVCAWSFRLGSFLTKRIYSHHPEEDGRYQELRVQYGDHVERGFFWFFQYQAWSVVLLAVPFAIMSVNSEAGLSPFEVTGAILFVLSLCGEAIADAQAKKFKTDPKNKGKTLQSGLWKYSRHPNYFFESCIWWGFYLMALSSPHGAFTVYAPLTILFLLLKVTGVPMSEAQSLKSRGDEYRDYQRRTSKFIPWFPMAMILFCLDGHTFAASLDRTALIYPLGKTSGQPKFTQKTHYEKTGDQTREVTTITDQKGKIVLTETAVTRGTDLISQTVDQFQTKTHYEVKMDDQERVFFYRSDLGEKDLKKIRESHERRTAEFVTGPTTEAFLAKHWDALLAGKTVNCRFGVLEVRETLGFEFKMKGKTKNNGKEMIQIEMKASSFIVGLAVDAFQIDFDPQSKRFIRFVGRTPLLVSEEDELKPFDGEVVYQ